MAESEGPKEKSWFNFKGKGDSAEEEVEEEEKDTKDTSALISDNPHPDIANTPVVIFNLTNYMFGPQLAISPFAINYAGPFLGAVLLVLCGSAVWIATALSVRVARATHSTTYQEIIVFVYKKKRFMYHGVTILELFHYIGAMTVLCILISDNASKFLTLVSVEWRLSDDFRIYVTVIMASIILLPLSVIRRTTRIAKMALLSTVCMGITLSAMIIRLNFKDDTIYEALLPSWKWKAPETAQFLAIVMFFFSMHRCCFIMYTAMKKKTIRRWNVAMVISLWLATILISLFGYVGYANFFQYIQGNVFENYCHKDKTIAVARFTSCCAAFCFFPVLCLYGRESLKHLFHRERISIVMFYLLTISLIFISTLFSFATRCVALLVIYQGPLICTPLTIIIPSLFYLKVAHPIHITIHKLAAIFLLSFGCLFVVYGLIVITLEVKSIMSLCLRGQEPYYCREGIKKSYE